MLNSFLKSKWTWWVAFTVLFVPLFVFLIHNVQKEEEAKKALEREKERPATKSEVARRVESKGVSETPGVVEKALDSQPTENLSAVDEKRLNGNSDMEGVLSPAKSDVIMEGPHKGMTLSEFEAHKIRGERLKALGERRRKHLDRLSKFTDESLQLLHGEHEVMLSLFKTFSSKELELAKKHALKEFPAEDVNELFDAIHNVDSKTLKEIGDATDLILVSDIARAILWEEIKIESEAIRQEYIDIIGVDVFE